MKQAVNSSLGKNHIGLYHCPEAILIDTAFFRSLPRMEISSALTELVKNAMILGGECLEVFHAVDPFSEVALNRLLLNGISAKAKYLAIDPHEQKEALIFEYGHTVGHAVEASGLGFAHGHAIGIGMLVAARIAIQRGWLAHREYEVHRHLLALVGAPTKFPIQLPAQAVANRCMLDNKRGRVPHSNAIPMVLLKKLGVPSDTAGVPLSPVRMEDILAAIEAEQTMADVARESFVTKAIRNLRKIRKSDDQIYPIY
jgi:3-dehydroquinate synthase/2-deoxy-scyllo-inosose synthase